MLIVRFLFVKSGVECECSICAQDRRRKRWVVRQMNMWGNHLPME
jgi:hypothetical protein